MLLTRRAALGATAGAILAPKNLLAADRSLRQIAAARGLLYGAATKSYSLAQKDFAAAFAREAGIMVAEYETKRDLIETVPGQYDFSAMDSLMAFARDNGMKFRGHPLVWFAANPPWLEQAVLETKKESLITDYIARLAGNYRGRIHSWDVVNEILNPEEGRPDNLRNCFWLQAYGPSYIDMAFHAARQADPSAMLVYNDWGCEAGEPKNDRFRAATLKFIDGLLKRNVPIDALGLQSHLFPFSSTIDQKKLAWFLSEISARGLKILVTELDGEDEGGPTYLAARAQGVADITRRYLDVLLDNSSTIAVLTWGLSNRFLESGDWKKRALGWRPQELPLDDELNRTPMWRAIAASMA